MVALCLNAQQGHDGVFVYVDVVLGSVGPHPVDTLGGILIEVVCFVAQIGRGEILVGTVVIIQTEISLQYKILYRFHRQIGVAEHAPVFMLVRCLFVDESHKVGCIVETERHLIVVISLRIIDGACRVHLDGILLNAAGRVVLTPPVECEVAAGFQAVVDKAIVRAETGIGFLEITPFDYTVMVEKTERHGGRTVIRTF